MSESFAEKLKSMFESNSVLEEIKDIANINLQKSIAILNSIDSPQDDKTINALEEWINIDERLTIKDDTIKSKVFELLEVMKGEEIRYELNGESVIGEANTPNAVLNIIINNYHSLITNKQ